MYLPKLLLKSWYHSYINHLREFCLLHWIGQLFKHLILLFFDKNESLFWHIFVHFDFQSKHAAILVFSHLFLGPSNGKEKLLNLSPNTKKFTWKQNHNNHRIVFMCVRFSFFD